MKEEWTWCEVQGELHPVMDLPVAGVIYIYK